MATKVGLITDRLTPVGGFTFGTSRKTRVTANAWRLSLTEGSGHKSIGDLARAVNTTPLAGSPSSQAKTLLFPKRR
jgi:hypothetical protein